MIIRNPDSTNDAGEIDVSKLAPQSRRHVEREDAERDALRRPDGRHLRRKGRTETLSFKVRPETVVQIQRLSQAEGTTMIEILERALEQYEGNLKGSR